jgi:hypothetical protein
MGHLVIGVGGTGFKALCMLKAQLQSINPAGTLPPGVALLAIDTESPDEALETKAIDIKQYGGVPLDAANEYVWLGQNGPPIGANLFPVGQALARGGLPGGAPGQIQAVPVSHFTSWFQARTLSRLMMANQWNISIGASQHRQMARLGLFWNVQGFQVSVFHQRMSGAITRATTAGDLNVYLVGSTVGGTGAGLFIDVAYLIRQLRGNVPCTVTAFLLLPESFGGILKGEDLQQAQSRTYACLREMERFSVGLMGHTHGFRIIYNPESPNAAYNGRQGTQEKLLDATYYVDGANMVVRGSNNVTLNSFAPEQGCIPLVADAILALLSETGNQRRVHMTNVATVMLGQQNSAAGAGGQDNPEMRNNANFSSGCGIYSIVLPIAQIIETLAWKLVGDTATLLARPGARAGMLDANRPAGGAGRSDLNQFCAVGPISGQHHNPLTQAVETIQAGSVPLLQDIRDEGQKYGEGTNQSLVQETARIFHDRTLRLWQQKLTLSGTDIGQMLQSRWDAELNKNFVTDDARKPVMVPVSPPGRDCKAAWAYIRGRVDEEFTNILGTRRANGSYTGGTIQGMINDSRSELLQIMRQRLRIWSLNILNGSQPADGTNVLQVERDRGNSVGYLYDFLRELGSVLSSYQRAIQAGQALRNREQGKVERLQTAYDSVREDGEQNPCPGLFNRGAEGLRRKLLDAAQELLDLRRVEQIEQLVLDVIQQFAKDVQGLRTAIEQWGTSLSTGGDALTHRAEEAYVRAQQLGARQDNPVRETIWDDQYNAQLYDTYSGGGPAKVIAQFNWWLLPPGEQGRMSFEAQLYQGAQRYTDGQGLGVGLYRIARGAFNLAWAQENILSYLEQRQNQSQWQPLQVTNRLNQNSQMALSAGNSGIPSAYIVLPRQTNALNAAYRAQLVAAVRGNDPLKRELEGTDLFRVSYITWRDAIGIAELTSFQRAEPQYSAYRSRFESPNPDEPSRLTRETLHAIPGEVQAVGIEARMPHVGVHPPLAMPSQVRRLHYEVIQQLEDIVHLRRFLNAWVWRVVKEIAGRANSQPVRVYGFELPSDSRFGRAGVTTEYWLTPPGGEPSLLEALWNWNYDWKDRHPASLDEQGRSRPNGLMSRETFDKIDQLAQQSRSERLDAWLTEQTNWLTRAPAVDQELYQRARADQQQRAARAWAELQCLLGCLDELHQKEQETRKKQNHKEQDAVAMLMVLLWEDIENLEKSWQAELRQT